MKTEFIPAPSPVFTAEWKNYPEAELIVFRGKELFLRVSRETSAFPKVAELTGLEVDQVLSIGERSGVPCFAVNLQPQAEIRAGHIQGIELRIAVGCLNESEFAAGCRAKELLHWRGQHRFCGKCGKPLAESEADAAMICPNCGERYYPQLAPAVIVGITRGDEILLAHNRKFLPRIHGLIAGFVEAGENIEQAIAREIREETGITVGNIRYFSSQCWPFPNSLMLGYTAEYVSGEAKPDGQELESLGWFRADALPPIPPKGSIARKMIDDFVHKHTNMRVSE